MIKIRKFKLSDLERIIEIEKVSFSQPWSKDFFKALYEKHRDDFLIAELSKKIVGYILGYKKSKELGSIKTMAVDPNRRRQGIGTKLINFLIKKLKKGGVKKIFLHIRTKNRIANAFYKKLGFKVVKTVKNYYQNGDNAYLMKKEI